MNKKGDTTIWQELVKAIPSILLFFFLIWAGIIIWNATHPEQHSQGEKDILRLIAEIKDLDTLDNNQGLKDTITVPVMTRGVTIKVVNTVSKDAKSAYRGCYEDYCLCFIKKGEDNPFICEAFNLRKEFGLEKKEDYKSVEFEPRDGVVADGSITLVRETNTKVTLKAT